MGIKRTPTGRIYFDAEEGRSDERQQQMVGLLGQLGERLKRSEDERDEIWKELQEYRKLIADIEDKTANSEKVFLSVQNKLSRAEKIEEDLSKRQDALEKSQKDHFKKLAEAAKSDPEILKRLDDSEALAAHLLEKLEASDAQQKRLDRRIEKITQDRVRIARKLERLEETVLETQDVLRAKALVLLTDQSIAAQTALPQIPATVGERPAIEHTDGETSSDGAPLWQRVLNPQAVATTAMVVVALLAGWTVSEIQRGRPASVDGVETIRLASVEPDAASSVAELSGGQTGSVWANLEERIAAHVAGGENDASAMPTSESLLEEVPVEALESGDYDENALALAMELDPEAVAARLNEIEPSAPGVAGEVEEAMEDAPAEAATRMPAPAKVREASLTKSVETQPPKADLRATMAPDKELPDVIKEIEKQAYDGIATAQHDLAAIYTAGHGGVKQNYEKAAFWFRQAAEQGIANARYNLGVLYHQGLGVRQDVSAAINWYQRAAELDHPEAQYNLGIAYIEGIGVPYDPQKAAMYFEYAADQDIMEAAYNLGLIHENGLLGDVSPEAALLWYKMAADAGSAEARRAMEQLAKTLKIDPSDVDRLVERNRAGVTGGVVPDGRSVGRVAALAADGAGGVVYDVQNQLIALGLFPGPADGVAGQQTADAIRVYQSRNGLPVDGKASESLLGHMLGGVEGSGEVGSREE